MSRPDAQQEPIFGFLSVLEVAEYGFFGGYLILNALGRPLEFHCTAPVRPSRAQEILYGPTLQPYLLGEQIGGTLLSEARLQPELVLTDHADTLCLREALAMPLVLVERLSEKQLGEGDSPHFAAVDAVSTHTTCEPDPPRREMGTVPDAFRTAAERGSVAGVAAAAGIFVDGGVPAIDASNPPHHSKRRFIAGGRELRLPVGFETDGPIVAELLTLLVKQVDVAEPFDRIHEAIREAQRIGERGEDSYVPQAA